MHGMSNIKCSMLIHPFFPILRPGGVCECSPEYVGNPYEACRPECVLNTECNRDQTCIRNKCRDPCPGTCGQNARCDVINHIPTCSCPSGFTGDPFSNCRQAVPGWFNAVLYIRGWYLSLNFLNDTYEKRKRLMQDSDVFHYLVCSHICPVLFPPRNLEIHVTKIYPIHVHHIQQTLKLFYRWLVMALALSHHQASSKNKGTEHFTIANV